MSKLILFDIDGTLISDCDDIHLQSFDYAFRSTLDKYSSRACDIDYSGKTDLEIIFKLLHKEGFSKEQDNNLINNIIREMSLFFDRNASPKNIKLLDGVESLLADMSSKDFLIGVSTGNIEFIARKKLEITKIAKYFKVGGFGDNHKNRVDLLLSTITTAENDFNCGFKNNIFVIGDTPRDVISGKMVGAKTIAVATGNYSFADLKKEKPDFIVKNFKNKESVLAIVN